MSAIVGLIRPAENSICGDQVLAYYINANDNLALKFIPLGAPDGAADVYTTNDAAVKGYVHDPSSLVALPVKNVTCIYGVITPSTTGSIALLSPVLQPLGISCEAIYGRIAGAADPKHGQAWIYYRKPGTTDTTVPGLTVYQASVTSASSTLGEVAAYTAGSNQDIADETYLAAYYNTNTAERHILFQKDDDEIVDYNIDHGDTIVTNAKPGRTPTGMAVVYVPELGKAFMYYVRAYKKSHKSAEIYELWKTETVAGKLNEWAQPAKVTPTMDILQNTQLHVTAWVERGENFIAYFNAAGQPACLHDRWDTADGKSTKQ